MTQEQRLSSMLEVLEKREREIELSRQELREKERTLATLMSNLDGLVYRCRNDADSTLEFASEGCHSLTGYHPAELLRNNKIFYSQITHPEDRERVREEIDAALHEHRRFFVEYRITCSSGELKWVCDRGVGIYGADGLVVTREGFIEDVTQRKLSNQALLRAERSFRSIFENAVGGIFQTAPDGRYLNVNPALAQLYGYANPAQLIEGIGEIQNQPYVDTTRHEEFKRLMLSQGSVTDFTSEIRRQDGEKIWISENARAVCDETGRLLFYEGTVEDVTHSKLNQEKLEYLANHDPVTSLPNRLLMNDRLRRMMLGAQRNNSIVAIALIDLDHFKLINDTFGHNRGDQLLQTVAQRMLACLRESDTVARLGGDEFVLLLSGEGRGEAISQVAQRVLESISQPWHIEDRELHVSCSMGVAVFPRDGRDVQTLLKNADTAMYTAKELGRNNFQFYSPEMNVAITERLEMQGALRNGVENDLFVLLYQPKIDLKTGLIAGMEALLRVRDGKGGLLSPLTFIRIAEESGLIVPIGEWVMRTACAFNKSLQARGLPEMRIAVNLSAGQLSRYDLVRAVEKALADAQLAPQCLELELTESIMMHDPESVIPIFEQLDQLGVQLSVDDFGTGYSSLSYLKRFPVTTLKIDQSFVRELGQDDDAAAIVRAVISLGHSMGLKIIAEGVETERQMAFLIENECDAMQGYLLAKPLSEEDFIALAERQRGADAGVQNLHRLCPSLMARRSPQLVAAQAT